MAKRISSKKSRPNMLGRLIDAAVDDAQSEHTARLEVDAGGTRRHCRRA